MATTFADLYDENERVELRGGFHVTLRKYLSAHDIFEADQTEHPGSTVLVTSIVEWDLTDKSGAVLPITVEAVEGLPTPVFNKLKKRVDELLKESSSAEADSTFQPEGDSSNPVPEV